MPFLVLSLLAAGTMSLIKGDSTFLGAVFIVFAVLLLGYNEMKAASERK